jgi:hypothetical protein
LQLLNLFQVGLNNFNQLLSAHGPAGVRFDDLGHQAVHCPAGSDHEMEHLGTAFLVFHRSLDRFDLTPDAMHSGQQLGFLFDRMAHPDTLRET